MRRMAGLIGIALAAALLATAASAEALSKPVAREQAGAKLRTYLAQNSAWAKRSRLGACQRRSEQRIICRAVVRGPAKSCRVRIAVTAKQTKLRRGKCKQMARLTPPPAKQPDAKRLKLGAWLGDPQREPLDPFRVTYPHGASAASQLMGMQEESEPAPPGVLALYVDGVLECAANVNDANPEASCPVDYDELGTYRVTTIFTSGSESAADTMMHDVEPLPTSVSLLLEFESFSPSLTTGEFDWTLGELTVDASVDVPSGPLALGCGPQGQPGCLPVPNVALDAPLLIEGRQCEAEDSRNAEPICLVRIAAATPWLAVDQLDNYFLRATQSPVVPGYVASEDTADLDFTPEIAFPLCDEENTGPWC